MVRSRRTPEEMIAEAKAKIERLEAKRVMDEAESHPDLAHALKALEGVTKEMVDANKGLGTGPQSFETRIESHSLWIDEIEAAKSVAKIQVEDGKLIAQAIRSVIGEFATKIANGQSVTEGEVRQATLAAREDNISEEYGNALDSFVLAQENRMAYNDAKREPKSKLKEAAVED